jgi:uncharacterized membrane protein (UPF0127 family)
MSKEDKMLGLKGFKIDSRSGLLFCNNRDVNFNFDFSSIPFKCIVYFLDKDFKVVDKKRTDPFQKNICIPKQAYRYAIEIMDEQ